MEISPDAIIIFQWNGIHINATIFFTWVVMVLLVFISWMATKNLTIGPKIGRWQNSLEVIIGYIRQQVKEITQQNPDPFIPFFGNPVFVYFNIRSAGYYTRFSTPDRFIIHHQRAGYLRFFCHTYFWNFKKGGAGLF